MTDTGIDDNEQTESCVFRSAREAVAWFLTHNPARAKSVNLIEPEHSDPKQAKFRGHDPADVYAAVTRSLRRSLEESTIDQRLAFNLAELGRPGGARQHPADVAKLLGIGERKVRFWIRRIYERIDIQLFIHGLIDPENFS